MTSADLVPPNHTFSRKQGYTSSYLHRDENRNQNITARGYIAPGVGSFENDFAPNDKSAFEWQKSPSGHSVASSTTSDSGFQSVTMLGASGSFNRSPNSAFSPRSPLKPEIKNHTDLVEPGEYKTALQYDSHRRSSSPVEDEPQNPIKKSSYTLRDDGSDFHNSSNDIDNYQAVSSYSTMPRSLRRRKFAAQRSPRNSEAARSLNSSSARTQDNDSAAQKSASTKSRSDALLKSFIEQAEERDRKARREQRTLSRGGRPRARSSSANRTTVGRSSSVGSEGQIFTGLRRSNSSVDMKKIINEAESRDRHARVEQARLQGVLPPRRYMPAKQPVKVIKAVAAATIIQKYEEKKQDDDPFLKHQQDVTTSGQKNSLSFYGHGYVTTDTRSEFAAPPHTVADDYTPFRTSRTSRYKKSPSSIHSDAGVNYASVRYTPRYREHRTSVMDSDDENANKQPATRPANQAPRPAMSMGNLQNAENDGSKTRALAEWQRTWEAKRAQNTYQRNRAKSSSSSALTGPTETRNVTEEQYNRRKQVESLFTGHVSPRQNERRSPKFSPPAAKTATDSAAKNRYGPPQHHSLDNPNYEYLPPPPTPPPESPAAPKTPEPQMQKKDTPRDYTQPSPKGYHKADTKAPSPKSSSHTMGRPVGGDRVPETAKVAPIPKNEKSKSSTLPRHFKSAPAWDVDSKQKAVQEQLNALRDEEIDELSARIDSLSNLEKSRLNNLLNEREFQRRVEEENRRIFSDEDISDEGYEVPDRPDRDRLIQLQGDHAEQVDARRDQEEEMRREEERERKKQLERERREEEERERQLRERLERERQFEEEERARREVEKRQREAERIRREEERWRIEEERARREEERRQYEEEERARREREIRKMGEERLKREEERRQREELERVIREEEKRKQEEERRRREAEEQEIQRQQWLVEERERREREEQEKMYQREREERQKELERIRNEREVKERALKEIQKSSEEDEKEEAERELLEKQLSKGKPSTFRKFNHPAAYGAASIFGRHTTTAAPYQPPTANKPIMRQTVDRGPRPVSDGYYLGRTDYLAEEKDLQQNSQMSASNYNVSATSPVSSSSAHSRSPVTHVPAHNTPHVIGTQERYRDPRDRREAAIKREQSMKRRQQEPSFMTFKDRQRLFSAGQNSPLDKPKASKKLLEIESNLRKSQIS